MGSDRRALSQIPIPMEARPLGPLIPEGFERVARGREAHTGSTWEREATLEGLKDSQPSHPAGVRIPSQSAFPRVRASHDPGLSAPIPPGCLHAGGVGAGPASWDKAITRGDEDVATPFHAGAGSG